MTSRSSVPRSDAQLEPVARRGRVERLVEDVDPIERPPAGATRSGRRARCRPRRRGCPSDDRAHENALALGQPDRAAHAPRHARRRERDAQAHAPRALAAPQALRPGRRAPRRRGSRRSAHPRAGSCSGPSSRPSGSTSGPPPEPRGSGAVCSMQPAIVRPRGPRISRPGGRDEPERGAQPATAAVRERDHRRADGRRSTTLGSQSTGSTSPVSTRTAARSKSGSEPATVPVSRRPSAKLTVTSSPRRLWAFVRTRPGSDDHAAPAPPPRPKPTTAGPTRSAAERDGLLEVSDGAQCDAPLCVLRVTSKLQVTRVTTVVRRLRSGPDATIGPHGERNPSARRWREALAAVGDRWTLLVVEALLDGPLRFGELRGSRRGDRSQHPHPARCGAWSRRAWCVAQPYSERPRRFVYELTDGGRELAGALRLLADWGARHSDAEPVAPRRLRHRARGALVLPHVRGDGRGAGRRGRPLRLTGSAAPGSTRGAPTMAAGRRHGPFRRGGREAEGSRLLSGLGGSRLPRGFESHPLRYALPLRAPLALRHGMNSPCRRNVVLGVVEATLSEPPSSTSDLAELPRSRARLRPPRRGRANPRSSARRSWIPRWCRRSPCTVR